jgi:hypothetical protein
MSDVYLPLSGAVTQAFNAWSSFFSSLGNTINFLTVNVGSSTNPDAEKQILTVASYGKQLGRIGDALAVLLKYLPSDLKLEPDEQRVITDLKAMLNDIANVKEQSGAKHVLWPPP